MRPRARLLAPLFATAVSLAACQQSEGDGKSADNKQADKQADKKEADKRPDKQPEAKPEPPKPPEGPVLTLGAAKIMPKDKPDQAIEIAADGKIKLGPKPEQTLTVSTDGKVANAEGKLVAQVAADGALTIGGKRSGIVLNETGLVLTAPGGKKVTLKFSPDGEVLFDPPPAEDMQMVSEGCTAPVGKTCALVISMYLLMGEGDSSSPAVEAPPAPEVAEPKKQP